MDRDTKDWLRGQLEPRYHHTKLPLWLAALLSMAVSQRRIANSLEAIQHGPLIKFGHVELKLPTDTADLQSKIEGLAWEAGRNFQHGMRTDR